MHNEDAGYDKVQSSRVLVEKDGSGNVHRRYQITQEGLKLSVEDIASIRNNRSFVQRCINMLSDVFMPAGYPNSVTADYFAYQLYDSLQAFSSSIAGLLASRAVLEGVGVGDATASATGALLLTIIQDAVGRLATILFAWRVGTALEPEAKQYRLLADIFNDSAMMMDCLSPALPKHIRVFSLCLSGSLRALCGVAAGGAKAALSIHFAKTNNVGDLNAKDSSQETVIGLLGMLAGSFVVSRVTDRGTTWALLLTLIVVHLLTNYLAVRAVKMNTLNRQRATLLYSRFRSIGAIESPAQIAERECIFANGKNIYDDSGCILGSCRVGVSFQELDRNTSQKRLRPVLKVPVTRLLQIFEADRYILQCYFCSPSHQRFLICLREDASHIDCLHSWIHAMELAYMIRESKLEPLSGEVLSHLLSKSHGKVNHEIFPSLIQNLQRAGWDLNKDAILIKPSYRLGSTITYSSMEISEDRKLK